MSNHEQPQPQRYHDTPFWKAYDGISQAIDHWIGWPNLPKPIGLPVLVGLRNILRQRNLYDYECASSPMPLFAQAHRSASATKRKLIFTTKATSRPASAWLGDWAEIKDACASRRR